MYKIKWTNTTNAMSGLCENENGIRRYNTEKAAIAAIKKFAKSAPEEIKYEVVK